MTGVLLATFSFLTIGNATADPRDPQAGSVGLTGTMPAKPPTIAATINSPKSGQHFSTSPVTITGTCPQDTLVEIYKNDIFAGSTPCDNGKFTIDVDLLFGENRIVAQVYDALNQGGPVSAAVTLYFDVALPQGSSLDNLNFGGAQLLLNTNAVYRGTFPGQNLNIPVTIVGGTPPYAVNVVWGDSNNKLIPRGDNTLFNASHTYDKAGTYKVTLAGTDSKQQVAFLTVAAIVNGQPSAIAGATANGGKGGALNKLIVLWPLYAVATTMVVSFWLGERREKKILDGPAGKTPAPISGITH